MRPLICLTLLLSVILCSGQNRKKLDSLFKLLPSQKEDTNAIKLLLRISAQYKKNVPDSALIFSQKALRLADKIKQPVFGAKALCENFYIIKPNANPHVLVDTLKRLLEDPRIQTQARYRMTVSFDLGINYRKISRFDRSINYLLITIALADSLHDKSQHFNGYNSLANTYSQMGSRKSSKEDMERALRYFDKAAQFIDPNDKSQEGNLWNNRGVGNYNIGRMTFDTSYIFKALYFYKGGLKIRSELKDDELILSSYGNIASCYHALCDLGNDTSYCRIGKITFEKCLKINEKVYGDKNLMLFSNYGTHLTTMGKLYKKKNLVLEGIAMIKKSHFLALKNGDLALATQLAKNSAQAYAYLPQNDSAVVYYKKYLILNDSLVAQENQELTTELAARFESDLKDHENASLKQQATLREEVISRKSGTIKIMIAASVIMGGLIILVFISLQNIRKSRALIDKQREEAEKQKEVIEGKNKEIIDSIKYAKRIQTSLLPTEKYVGRILKKKE